MSVVKVLVGWALILAIAACDQAPSGPGAPQAAPAVTVARPIVRPVIEWDEYSGRFDAVNQVAVRSRVTGHLASVHFKDGQMVDPGQLLFVIDPRPFQIALDRALADVDNATAVLELANVELGRAQQLLKSDNVARATFDLRRQEKAAAEAQLAIARAEVERARLDLAYARIHAPIPGRASDRQVDPGNLITAGTDTGTILTTIVSLDPIHFHFSISEADYIRYQRLGAPGFRRSSSERATAVQVQVGDETSWERVGYLDFVDNVLDPSTGTMRGRAVFPNPDLTLTPGQFGRIRLAGSESYEAIQIPETAVITDQSNKVVLVVGADNTIEVRPVQLGPVVDGLRIVREGLGPEEWIVINGLLRARPNAPVTPERGVIALPKATAPRPNG